MSSSTDLNVEAFKIYLKNGNRQLLRNKTTDYYKLLGPVRVDFDIHPSISELRDFNFDQGIEFIGCSFKNGLNLYNCKGRGGLKFINCRSVLKNEGDAVPDLGLLNFTFDHLSFETCNFQNGVILHKNDDRKEANILSSIEANPSTFGGWGFQIESTTIKHGIFFNHVDGSTNLLFRNIETGDSCKFLNVESQLIHFSGENLKLGKGLVIERPILNELKFTEGSILGDLKIIEPRIRGLIGFNSTSISGKTAILDKKEGPYSELEDQKIEVIIPQIFINSTDFNEGFSISGDGKLSKKIGIDFSPLLKGRLQFSNLNIGELVLRGTNSENNLIFRNTGFKRIDIDDFSNLEKLTFSNLNDEFTRENQAVFKVKNSDLGNWELGNFDFSAFIEVFWQDSQISDLKTSAVTWFKDSAFKTEGENHRLTCFRRREFYRQLKLSSQKQGDRIAELEFKGREISAHQKGLKLRNEKRFDRWAILAGKTNDHGQNWIKPLFFILGISMLFFPILFYYADPEIDINPDISSKGFRYFGIKIWEHFATYPQLFNPARRISDLFPNIEKFSFGVYFFDGLQRIVLAFFIFQIVSAFRKFVK